MPKAKPKKRGRKPGVKVGPYKKAIAVADDGLDALRNKYQDAIKARIKYLNLLLKRIK